MRLQLRWSGMNFLACKGRNWVINDMDQLFLFAVVLVIGEPVMLKFIQILDQVTLLDLRKTVGIHLSI
jgi:hypothetical protein